MLLAVAIVNCVGINYAIKYNTVIKVWIPVISVIPTANDTLIDGLKKK